MARTRTKGGGDKHSGGAQGVGGTDNIHNPAPPIHWLILGVGCGAATLYLMVWAWQDVAFVQQWRTAPADPARTRTAAT